MASAELTRRVERSSPSRDIPYLPQDPLVAPLSTRQFLATARIKAPGVYIQEHDESDHEHEADDRKPRVPGRRQVGEFEPSLQTPPSVPAQAVSHPVHRGA
jgi:hypothetical protein